MSSKDDLHASIGIVSMISELLRTGNYDEALTQVNNSENLSVLKDNVWDLIPKVCDFLNSPASTELRNCCQDILERIVIVSQPEEAILEFIEQAEYCENNQAKFTVILKVLKICLYKLPERGRSLDWCLNAIEGHVATLVAPARDKDGKENKTDPLYNQVINVYTSIIEFYRPFLYENISPFSLAHDVNNEQRKTLVCFLLHMLGKPLMHLDLKKPILGNESKPRKVANELMTDLSNLVSDLFLFLHHVESREKQRRSKFKELTPSSDHDENGMTVDDYLREDRVTTLSLGFFYYLVLAEGIKMNCIPHVYNPIYIFQNTLYLATVLLNITDEECVVHKGLLLAESVSSRLSDLSVPFGYLDSPVHKEFAEAVTMAAIYSEGLEIRRLAIKVLKDYIFKFDMKGRYLLMSNLILLVDHSSMIGYLAMLFKDMILCALNSKPIPIYFRSQSLFGLLKEFIKVPEGERCDLAENRDRILAALNLLLFVLSRDNENITGVWDNVDCINELCVNPLEKAIDVSRGYYKIKLTDLAEGNKTQKPSFEAAEVDVAMLGGGRFEPASDACQLEAVQFALNGFDLMENLLVLLKNRIESGL